MPRSVQHHRMSCMPVSQTDIDVSTEFDRLMTTIKRTLINIQQFEQLINNL